MTAKEIDASENNFFSAMSKSKKSLSRSTSNEVEVENLIDPKRGELKKFDYSLENSRDRSLT